MRLYDRISKRDVETPQKKEYGGENREIDNQLKNDWIDIVHFIP